MKRTVGIDIGSYTFNASEKQIIFSEISSLVLSQFLLITNTTRNIIIYNFADQNNGATSFTQSGTTYILTLKYDTTSMEDTDSLQIFIEVSDNTEDQIILLRKILTVLESNAIVDYKKRQKIIIDAVGTTETLVTEQVPVIDPETGEPVIDPETGLQETIENTYTTVLPTECETSIPVSCLTGTSLTSGGQGPTASFPTLATTVYWPIWEGPIDQRWRVVNKTRRSFGSGIRCNLNFK